MEYSILAIIISGTLSIIYLNYIKRSDIYKWNKGKCRCGGDWIHFGLSIRGSRMYKCKYCDNEVIITSCDVK